VIFERRDGIRGHGERCQQPGKDIDGSVNGPANASPLPPHPAGAGDPILIVQQLFTPKASLNYSLTLYSPPFEAGLGAVQANCDSRLTTFEGTTCMDWHSLVIGALSFVSWCLLARVAVSLLSSTGKQARH